MASQQTRKRLSQTKKLLGWESLTDSARSWWDDLESLNTHQLDLVLLLAEELFRRSVSIQDFFVVCSCSNFVSVDDNLRLLDVLNQDNDPTAASVLQNAESPVRDKALYH